MPAAAILLGIVTAVSAAAATVVASELTDTAATDPRPGAWQISGGLGPAAWKLNTQTGALYYCTRANACTLVEDK
jgi:hypothetical protein